jgi:hypothetical protein
MWQPGHGWNKKMRVPLLFLFLFQVRWARLSGSGQPWTVWSKEEERIMVNEEHSDAVQSFLNVFGVKFGKQNTSRELVITEIKEDGGRVLLFGGSKDFYVIAPRKLIEENLLKIGDLVEHDNCGSCFGFFVRVVKQ